MEKERNGGGGVGVVAGERVAESGRLVWENVFFKIKLCCQGKGGGIEDFEDKKVSGRIKVCRSDVGCVGEAWVRRERDRKIDGQLSVEWTVAFFGPYILVKGSRVIKPVNVFESTKLSFFFSAMNVY